MKMETYNTEKYAYARSLKLYAIEQILEGFDKLIYHNVDYANRSWHFLKESATHYDLAEAEVAQLEAALWLHTSTFAQLNLDGLQPEEIPAAISGYTEHKIPTLLKRAGTPESEKGPIKELLKVAGACKKAETKAEQLLWDTIIYDLTGNKGIKKLRELHQEAVLNNLKISSKNYYALMHGFFLSYEAQSTYARQHIKPKVDSLLLDIEKEQRKLRRKKDVALKRELNISNSELKALRKNLQSVEGRDGRGIQTLFRTTSHNHYTLNEMVDRKANIMITVNSIILSVVIGGFLRLDPGTVPGISWGMLSLSLAALLSIIFAIISITPNKTQGKFSREDIKNKNGNLLYFGNFHKMSFKDYEWGMLQKLNDSAYLYSSMIKDLYYLGRALQRKYKFIRLSLGIFLVGLIVSFLLTFTRFLI